MTVHSKRYSRQIGLPEIGISGQQKLTEAKVLLIGAGGLGCPVLQNLVAAGVGCIGVVDGDVVEETNLHRQLLYSLKDCGENKATIAARVLFEQNPEVKVIPYSSNFTLENAFQIVADYQIIVDCTDNLATRYLINDVALVKGIPMVYASIHRFEGQLSVLNYKSGPSYRCLFSEKEAILANINCADLGVLGILPNTLGVLQATEVLKIILGIGSVLNGKLLLYDGLHHKMQTIDFKSVPSEKEIGLQKGFSILNNTIDKTIGIINAATFYEEASNQKNLVIDLREDYEEPKLELSNSKNVPLNDLEHFLEKVNKNKKIILFCQSGNRSFMAAQYLLKNGFTTIFHLEKGVDALTKQQLQ